MNLTRRRFLKYCSLSAAAIGLEASDMGLLREALANPSAPSVIWLKGSACDGCSISLLNRISDSVPYSITEVLTDHINLVYHTNLMALAGETSVAVMREVYEQGNYVLVVEGGVPTAFDGHCCVVYSFNGREVTFQESVQEISSRASHIVCAGTCASWGGIPGAGSNPSKVVGVKELTGRTTVNIAGCPTNPDWLVWGIVQILLGNPIPLDSFGRPTALFQAHGTIHEHCPREEEEEADRFGTNNQCLKHLGCRGPATLSHCQNCWNGKADQAHWCIGVNAPCHGCVEPSFPGPESFYREYPYEYDD